MSSGYLLLKAAHIVVVIVWMGGMLVQSVVLAHLANAGFEGRGIVDTARRLDRCLTTPAMLLAWLFGGTLALARLSPLEPRTVVMSLILVVATV